MSQGNPPRWPRFEPHLRFLPSGRCQISLHDCMAYRTVELAASATFLDRVLVVEEADAAEAAYKAARTPKGALTFFLLNTKPGLLEYDSGYGKRAARLTSS